MTVYIEKPAVNLREELASLRNQGGYQEQQFYFDGLVTNGTFDADLSGWTAGKITWSSGVALKDSAGTGDGNAGNVNQPITFSRSRVQTPTYQSTTSPSLKSIPTMT